MGIEHHQDETCNHSKKKKSEEKEGVQKPYTRTEINRAKKKLQFVKVWKDFPWGLAEML